MIFRSMSVSTAYSASTKPAIQDAVDRITSSPANVLTWQVPGRWSAGKTSFLRAIAQALQERGQISPIIINPPAGEMDAGPFALMQLGIGLSSVTGSSDFINVLTEPSRPWSEKLKLTGQELAKCGNRVALICDEPMRWATFRQEDAHFAERVSDVRRLLFHQPSCRRIVSGRLPPGEAGHALATPASEGVQGFLRSRSWGRLAMLAQSLAERLEGHEGLTALDFHLGVGYAHVAGLEAAVERYHQHVDTREMASRFAEKLFDLGEYDLLKIWGRLAMARRPFRKELLDRLMGAKQLSELGSELLHGTLLFETDEGFDLHGVLRQAIRNTWREERKSQRMTHRVLAEYYYDRFRQRGSEQPQLLSMEAYHHASETADPSFMGEIGPYFQEQLCIRGKALSLYAQRAPDREPFKEKFDKAASLFREALNWDSGDDYAHHYYAFNLDVRGREAAQVAEHYKAALYISPENVWWHSRWISFLITRGRIPEARQAWYEALAILEQIYEREDEFLYLHLHRWVAKLLLRSGQLVLAGKILEHVPKKVVDSQPFFGELLQHLQSLSEAQRNRTVFPARILPQSWWQEGPHLCERRDAEGVGISRWMPGRVATVVDEVVALVVAKPPQVNEEPVYGHWEISRKDFDDWSHDELSSDIRSGRFVEIAFYGDADRPVIRIHRELPRASDSLRIDFPDPNRYLRAKGRVR